MVINPTFLILKDYGLSNIISESEGTYIRRKNREKCRIELEKLDQEDNHKQQTC